MHWAPREVGSDVKPVLGPKGGADVFDAIVDFEQALRDPDRPTCMLPVYDAGDHLHPQRPGHRAMGDAIDVALFE